MDVHVKSGVSDRPTSSGVTAGGTATDALATTTVALRYAGRNRTALDELRQVHAVLHVLPRPDGLQEPPRWDANRMTQLTGWVSPERRAE